MNQGSTNKGAAKISCAYLPADTTKKKHTHTHTHTHTHASQTKRGREGGARGYLYTATPRCGVLRYVMLY